jgi:hypothetical protein
VDLLTYWMDGGDFVPSTDFARWQRAMIGASKSLPGVHFSDGLRFDTTDSEKAELLLRYSRIGYQHTFRCQSDTFLLPGRLKPKHPVSHRMLFTDHRSTRTLNAYDRLNGSTPTRPQPLRRRLVLY